MGTDAFKAAKECLTPLANSNKVMRVLPAGYRRHIPDKIRAI